MIENTEVYASMDLTQLAEEAVNAADAAVRNSRAAVVQAVNAGRLLIAAKAKVEHGQWKQWLEDNWVSQNRAVRTAQRFMSLAATDVDVSKADSIREALHMLAEAKMERAPFLDDGKNDTRDVFEPEPTPAANLTPADIPEPEPQVTTPAERDPQPRPTIREVTPETTQQIDRGTSEPPKNAVDEVFAALERLAGEQADQRDMANRLRALADKLDPPKKTWDSESLTYPESMDSAEVRAAMQTWIDYRRREKKSIRSVKSANAILKKWADKGPERFVAAVSYSEAQQYQGLYEEKSSRAKEADYAPGDF